MVQIEIRAGGGKPTVLTGEVISQEDIRAADANLALGNAIESGEDKHARNRNRPTGRTNPVAMIRGAIRSPAFEIKGLIGRIDRTGASPVKKREGASDRCDINRQKRTVQNKNIRVQHFVPMKCYRNDSSQSTKRGDHHCLKDVHLVFFKGS
jgi:hypothetical protein